VNGYGTFATFAGWCAKELVIAGGQGELRAASGSSGVIVVIDADLGLERFRAGRDSDDDLASGVGSQPMGEVLVTDSERGLHARLPEAQNVVVLPADLERDVRSFSHGNDPGESSLGP
jgi:hypothetical protein